VGTPGRLLKHLEKESLALTNIETLVLDEADRMLDMGFSEDISKIISFIPDRRQTLLFSATYPDEIEYISKSIQLNPVTIKVDSDFSANQITQIFYKAPKPDRVQILIQVLKFYQPESALVFCNTIEQCEVLVGELIKRDVHALALHGDLEQFNRDQVLVRFSNRSTSVLVATDVAARGGGEF
jgi:ATP-independent RNA helicase DbpA